MNWHKAKSLAQASVSNRFSMLPRNSKAEATRSNNQKQAARCRPATWKPPGIVISALITTLLSCSSAVYADVTVYTPYGTTTDGVYTAYVDDTEELQQALDTYGQVSLEPYKTYRITRTLHIRRNGGGLIGDGRTTLVMGAGPGEFDNASPNVGERYGENAVGISADHVSGPIIRGLRIYYENQIDDRYVKAIAVRGSTNFSIQYNEIWNFTKSLGVIYVGGSEGGTITKNKIHDCSTNSTTPGQITGIEFDNDDIPSKDVEVAYNEIRDLTVGPNFKSSFGFQTDGINTVRNGTVGLNIHHNDISNVGEGIDHFGRDSRITNNTLSQCYNFCIKLVHGASNNLVFRNWIRNAGLGGIVLSGSSNAASGDTAENRIVRNRIVSVDGNGDWQNNSSFGIALTANGGTANLPRRNLIRENYINLKNTGKFGILATVGSGSGNIAIGNVVIDFAKLGYLVDNSVIEIFRDNTYSKN